MIDCDVYADADAAELEKWLEHEFGTRLHVDRSHDRDPIRAREFPDGFLYFSSLIEAGPQELVARLLPALWKRGIPAVASCDYEDELPERGGYKSRAVPWPG